MTAYSNSPESLDERFIQILIEELGDGSMLSSESVEGRSSGFKTDASAEEAADEPIHLLGDEVLTPKAAPAVGEQKPATGTGRWHLRVIEADGREQTVKLAGHPVSIGRSRRNTVVVRCSRVSRRHLRIWTEGEALWVEEVSDHHRMSVNGIQMPRSWLQPDDEIEVGSVRILVTREDEAPVTHDAPPVE